MVIVIFLISFANRSVTRERLIISALPQLDFLNIVEFEFVGIMPQWLEEHSFDAKDSG